MKRVRLSIIALIASLLVACASTPGLPETTYYRLPAPAPVAPFDVPPVELPVVVDPFAADGLYSDQALIYGLDAEGTRLRSYHYQLWIDPPSRLLQRRLLAWLRARGVTRIVTDRLPSQMPALRVQGRIARLERLPLGEEWQVAVAVVLRAEPAGGGKPWVIGEYQRLLPVEGAAISDTVRAIGQALDDIFGEFADDLVARAADPDGRIRQR